jgi:hypothetical protein
MLRYEDVTFFSTGRSFSAARFLILSTLIILRNVGLPKPPSEQLHRLELRHFFNGSEIHLRLGIEIVDSLPARTAAPSRKTSQCSPMTNPRRQNFRTTVTLSPSARITAGIRVQPVL